MDGDPTLDGTEQQVGEFTGAILNFLETGKFTIGPKMFTKIANNLVALCDNQNLNENVF